MKSCPLCGNDMRYDDWDDFCPIHHIRLVARSEEETPESAAEAAPDRQDEEAERDQGFFDRLKRKFSYGRKASSCAGDAAQSGEELLPEQLTSQGWAIDRPLVDDFGANADHFLVSDALGRKAVFKRYRNGSDTSAALYAKVQDAPSPNLVPLDGCGTMKVAGTDLDWELLAAAEAHRFSHYLIEHSISGEPAVTWFLREVLPILDDLERLELICCQIHPGSLGVTSGGTLVLNDFSQLYDARPEDRFIPGCRNLNIEYAAPEILNQRILAASRSVLFSIGAVAARMAWGYTPSQRAILLGDLDFAQLPQALVPPFMGLLYPDPKQRWGKEDLAQWLKGTAPSVPDWSRLKPGASDKAFILRGRSIYLPEDLAEPLYQDLDAAAAVLDQMLTWLDGNPRVRDIALEIRRSQAAGETSDWLVLRLAFLLNPRHPRSWRGISLDEDALATNLAELGRRAAVGDQEAAALVARLYEANLNTVFSGGAQ